MRLLVTLALLPAFAMAQTTPVTEFPADAQTLAPDALQARLVGNVFTFKGASGPEIRLQFKDSYVFVNAGSTSDSGTWKIEGTTLCIQWQRINGSGCSEARLVADAIHLKRTSNGEVVRLVQK